MEGMSTGEPRPTLLVTTRLEPESHAELARRAAEADRTIAAELRRAVRFYLTGTGEPEEAAA
jgi:hypothetical protein